jgi:hypothetical protein
VAKTVLQRSTYRKMPKVEPKAFDKSAEKALPAKELPPGQQTLFPNG